MLDEEVVAPESTDSDESAFATVEMTDLTTAERNEWLKTGKTPDRHTPKDQKAKAEDSDKAKKSVNSTQSSDTDEDKTGAASETDDKDDKTDKTSEPKAKQPDRAEKRKAQLSQEIVTLLDQSKTAKKELAELQKQLAEIKSGTATTTKPEKETTKAAAADRPKKPVWKEFDAAGKSWDEYEEARDKWQDDVIAFERKETERSIKETLEAERKEFQKNQHAAEIQEQNKKIEESWKKRMSAVEKRLGDDFDADKFFALKVNSATDKYLLKIDEGAEVWNYLAMHPEEAEEIFVLDDFDTMERLVPIRKQIQEELKPKDKKPVLPRATKPPTDVGGKNAAPTDEVDAALDKDDFKAYQREQNRRDIEARKARLAR